MSKVRLVITAIIVLGLLAIAIFFWGSMASALSILALLLIPGVVAYRMLWIDRENRVVDDMDPMNIIYNRHMDIVENGDE